MRSPWRVPWMAFPGSRQRRFHHHRPLDVRARVPRPVSISMEAAVYFAVVATTHILMPSSVCGTYKKNGSRCEKSKPTHKPKMAHEQRLLPGKPCGNTS